MLAIVRIFLVFIVAFPTGNAYAGWFGPSNYEECILDKMKDAKSNVAAAAIVDACRKKFPTKKKVIPQVKAQGLSADVIGRIQLACNERDFDAYFRASSQNIEAYSGPKSIAQYLQQYEDMQRPEAIKCSLYNGNDRWTVSRLTVRVTDLNSRKSFDSNVWMFVSGSKGVPPLQNASALLGYEPVIVDSSIVTGKFLISIISAEGFIAN